jgi:hypothetical protein
VSKRSGQIVYQVELKGKIRTEKDAVILPILIKENKNKQQHRQQSAAQIKIDR